MNGGRIVRTDPLTILDRTLAAGRPTVPFATDDWDARPGLTWSQPPERSTPSTSWTPTSSAAAVTFPPLSPRRSP